MRLNSFTFPCMSCVFFALHIICPFSIGSSNVCKVCAANYVNVQCKSQYECCRWFCRNDFNLHAFNRRVRGRGSVKIGPIDERQCEPNEIMMPTETTSIAHSNVDEQNDDIKLQMTIECGISADYFSFFRRVYTLHRPWHP